MKKALALGNDPCILLSVVRSIGRGGVQAHVAWAQPDCVNLLLLRERNDTLTLDDPGPGLTELPISTGVIADISCNMLPFVFSVCAASIKYPSVYLESGKILHLCWCFEAKHNSFSEM